MDAPNGTASKLVWWILTGACTLVLVLGSALANDIRNTLVHNANDITSLQASQAATTQALEDIRRDVHELVERDRERR